MSDRIIKNELFKGKILELEINNTTKSNAISEKMLEEIIDILKNKKLLKKYRILTIKGYKEEPFSSGADLKNLFKSSTKINSYNSKLLDLLTLMDQSTIPKVALINSYCFGAGLLIALKANIVLANKNAVFCIPAAKLGLIIPKEQLNRFKNKFSNFFFYNDIILTSRKFNAKEALQANLISQIINKKNFLKYYYDYLENILSKEKLIISHYMH